jgi:hypothetical protein
MVDFTISKVFKVILLIFYFLVFLLDFALRIYQLGLVIAYKLSMFLDHIGYFKSSLIRSKLLSSCFIYLDLDFF